MGVVTFKQSATTLLEVSRVRANRDIPETELPVQVKKYSQWFMLAVYYTNL